MMIPAVSAAVMVAWYRHWCFGDLGQFRYSSGLRPFRGIPIALPGCPTVFGQSGQVQRSSALLITARPSISPGSLAHLWGPMFLRSHGMA
jgi:hypothetical protein